MRDMKRIFEVLALLFCFFIMELKQGLLLSKPFLENIIAILIYALVFTISGMIAIIVVLFISSQLPILLQYLK